MPEDVEGATPPSAPPGDAAQRDAAGPATVTVSR